MAQKPPYQQFTREQLIKKVAPTRWMMKTFVKSMMDLDHALGKKVIFETDKGPVTCLTYGFSDPEVKPVLFNMHGGGFVIGSAAMDDPSMPQFADKCGVKVVNIEYSLSPEVMFPTAVDQCYAVMEYVKAHAAELGVDSDRMMIMGHSAGGNFCASIGIRENSEQKLGLKGIILDYPPTDIVTDPYDKPIAKGKGALKPKTCRVYNQSYCAPDQASDPRISPAFAQSDQVDHFPPTLVITAQKDSLADEGKAFADKLKDAGVDVTHRCFEDVGHGFTQVGTSMVRPGSKEDKAATEAWKLMMDFVSTHI